MSDTFTSDNGDETITLTVEETEAAESFDLRSLGIDPRTTPFEDLLKIYREQVGICNDYAAKQKSGATDPTSVDSVVKSNVTRSLKGEVAEAKATVEEWRTVGTNLTDKVFHFLGEDRGTLISTAVMLDEVRNLLNLMEDEYQYHLNAAIQAEKDAKGITSTPSETAIRAKLACIKLKGTKPGEGLINARVQMAKVMEEELPSNLYTGGIRNRFNKELVPNLPRLDVEGTLNPNSTHLSFRWSPAGDGHGEEPFVNCSETTVADVAHNVVSKGAYRITAKRVFADLKKAGHGIGATTEEWSLTYRTGTLFGKKV